MAGRGGKGNNDEGLSKRPKRNTANDQDRKQDQQQETEKENALPEQNMYGNSFLLGAMGSSQDTGGAPADGGVEYEAVQDYGGIEDGDPGPSRPAAEDGDWFRPRFRRKGKEIEPMGQPDAPPEPGIPPEDADWLDSLEPTGAPWDEPAPQPPATALDDQLGPWLRALYPLAGPLPCQLAIAAAISHDAALQDPSGSALLGIGAAATLGGAVAHQAGHSRGGRLRMQRGLAAIAAPYIPREAARTAHQLAGLDAIPTAPSGKPDPWISRLLVARLGLEAPPTPELDDPPNDPAPVPDEVLDYDALIQAELGDPPDPIEALRAAALEGCESQARWAVALRAGAASCARALADNGVDHGILVAVLQRCDQLVGQAIQLLQEIAQAARRKQVPIRGLRNGLTRSAQLLGTAHRNSVQGLAAAAAVPDAPGRRPDPSHVEVELALRDGRPIPELDSPQIGLHSALESAFTALAEERWEDLLALTQTVRGWSVALQNGAGVATAALFAIEALHQGGKPEAAQKLRRTTGNQLLGAGARTGVSLLARWEPVDRAADAPIPPLPAYRPRGPGPG